jgi:hypothetical protein
MAPTEVPVPQFHLDLNLLLSDGATLTSSAAGQVSSAAKVIDFKDDFFSGEFVADVTALVINDNDEKYVLILEGSDTDSFTAADTDQLAVMELGAQEVKSGTTQQDDTVGRYSIGFTNHRNGKQYRYGRLYVAIAGTSPSITLGNVFLAKQYNRQ